MKAITEVITIGDYLGPRLDVLHAGGGTSMALRRLTKFLDQHIPQFAAGANDPDSDSRQTRARSSRIRPSLGTSRGGRQFQKSSVNPIFKFGDGKHSILTPTILREGNQWRMWFAATDFTDSSGLHTLHASTSRDGLQWSAPSAALLANVYAPIVIKLGEVYHLWCTHLGKKWLISHAVSNDGSTWNVSPDPVLTFDQTWESGRLFYPTVVHQDGLFLMWYASRTKPPFVHKYFAIGSATWKDNAP